MASHAQMCDKKAFPRPCEIYSYDQRKIIQMAIFNCGKILFHPRLLENLCHNNCLISISNTVSGGATKKSLKGHVFVIRKLDMKLYVMHMCISWLCPFNLVGLFHKCFDVCSVIQIVNTLTLPSWAPWTRPAISTTCRKAGTLLKGQHNHLLTKNIDKWIDICKNNYSKHN